MLWKKLIGSGALVGGGGGGASPVLETWAKTVGAASTTLTLTAPASIAADDTLIIIIGCDDTSSSTIYNAVTGWTKVGEAGTTASDAHVAVYWKNATGSEGDQAVTSTVSKKHIGWFIRVSGGHTTAPIDVSNFAAAGATSSRVIPSVTTTVANTLAFYGLMFDGGDGDPFGEPSGWTEVDEGQSGTTTTADVSGVFGHKDQATAGATGDATVSCNSSDGSAYFQLAIAPA